MTLQAENMLTVSTTDPPENCPRRHSLGSILESKKRVSNTLQEELMDRRITEHETSLVSFRFCFSIGFHTLVLFCVFILCLSLLIHWWTCCIHVVCFRTVWAILYVGIVSLHFTGTSIFALRVYYPTLLAQLVRRSRVHNRKIWGGGAMVTWILYIALLPGTGRIGPS